MTKEQIQALYTEAERLKEEEGTEQAYYFLMEMLYYRINGQFKKK